MKKLKKIRFYIFFLLIGAVSFYVTFLLYPIFQTIVYSLYEGSGLEPEVFVGLKNYIRILTEIPYKDIFFNALKNNFKYYALVTLFRTIGGLFLALLLTRKYKGSVFFRRISYLPVTIAIIFTGFMFQTFLSPRVGFVDNLLRFLHLEELIRPWLSHPSITIFVIAIVAGWHNIGISTLIYCAGIDGIDHELLEASHIDGASEIGTIKHVILPLLIPIIRSVFILGFIDNFQAFELIYAMVGSEGGVRNSSDIMGTLFYRTAFTPEVAGGWGIGMGTAVGTLTIIIIGIGTMVIIYIFNKLREKYI